MQSGEVSGSISHWHGTTTMQDEQKGTRNNGDSTGTIPEIIAPRYHDSWDEDSSSSHDGADDDPGADVGDDLEEAGTFYDPSAEFLPINRTKVRDIELARDLVYGSVFVYPELFPHESQLNVTRLLAEHFAFLTPTTHNDGNRDVVASLPPKLVENINQFKHMLPLNTEWDRSTLRAIIDMLNCVKIDPPQELFNAIGDPRDFRIIEYRAHSPQIHDKDFWEDYERYLFKLFGGRDKWKERVARLQAMAFAQVESKENHHKTISQSITQKKRAAVATEAGIVPQPKRIAFQETEGRQTAAIGSSAHPLIGDELVDEVYVAKKQETVTGSYSVPDTHLELREKKMPAIPTDENRKGGARIAGTLAKVTAAKPPFQTMTMTATRATVPDTPSDEKALMTAKQTEGEVGRGNDMMATLDNNRKSTAAKKAAVRMVVPNASKDEAIAVALPKAEDKVISTRTVQTETFKAATQLTQSLPTKPEEHGRKLVETIAMGQSPMERLIWNKYRLTFAQYNQALLDGCTPDQYSELLDRMKDHTSAILSNVNRKGPDRDGFDKSS